MNGIGETRAPAPTTTTTTSTTRSVVTRAPYEVDPLTWLAGNRLPLAFAALILIACGGSIIGIEGTGPELLAQYAALAVMIASCLVVYWFARPARGPFTRTRTLLPLMMALGATAISAANVAGVTPIGAIMSVEFWWAPLGVALVIGSLTPYSSVVRSFAHGSLALVVTGVCSALSFQGGAWPLVSTIAIGSIPIVLATAGAIAFQAQVAIRIEAWAAREAPAIVTGAFLSERSRIAAVRTELASVLGRVTPLLKDVADRGEVTEVDRARAAELASEIRSELVERSNQSWLDIIAHGRPMTVIDPEHLADTMGERQRSMVHGLLLAVLDSPEVEYPQLLIELRGEPDGSTAVAITIDAGLAEGRRIMLLAPHYLTLRTAVDDLRWKGGDTIRMRFRVSPET